jgi:ribosomal protein S18 acetylase RimI-like enzyme
MYVILDLPHFYLADLMPLSAVTGYYLGGSYTFLIPLLAFGVIPLLNFLISPNRANSTPEELEALARKWNFRLATIKTNSMAGGDPLVIRAATREDADAIGEFARQFADYLRSLGDPTDFRFNAEAYLRDSFGPHPAFSGLAAELDGQIVGYLLYNFSYDTDKAIRLLHVLDLYVHESARRHGVGRALMQAAANICREAGGSELFWVVYAHNRLALTFYENLGAHHAKDLQLMFWPI